MSDNSAGIVFIVVTCLLVLLIGIMKRKSEWLLNFIIRAVLGIIAIFVFNRIFEGVGYSVSLGINVVTVLTSGTLGLPGVAALYALQFYNLL